MVITGMDKLTNAERSIMLLLKQGYTVEYISKNLFIAKSTILNHLQHIYEKYDIPANNKYNRRVRAIYIFNQQEQNQYPLKVLTCFKVVEKHIEDYKQWLLSESEEV